MLNQDVVRRLTVVASDTGLTTLTAKLDAVDKAQDRIAVSSTLMGRATEDAQRRMQAISAQAGGLFGGFAGRSATEALAMVGRIAPVALAAYAAFKLVNATIEQGVALLEKYGLAGQRALYDEGKSDALDKLMRFQGDTTTLQQQKTAANLSGRMDEANRQIKEFLKVNFDLTDAALKLMNVWVLINEQLAKAANLAAKIPAPAASIGGTALIGALPGGAAFNAARGAINYFADKPSAAPSAEEAFRIAQGRLGAGLAAGGMIGKDASAGFYGRFNAVTDKPEKEAEKARTAWDRALDSVSKNIAITEAQAKAVDAGAGAQARFRVEAELTEAALRGKLDPASKEVTDEIERLGARADAAATQLAKLRLASDTKFERDQLGRSDQEAGVASKLRGVYGSDYVNQMHSATAEQIRFNEQIKVTKGLTDEFANSVGSSMTSALTDLAMGTKSASEAFKGLGLSVLRSLEEMIIKMTITIPLANALKASLGSGGFFGSLFGGGNMGAGGSKLPATWSDAGVAHDGGVAGSLATRRLVHPAYFDDAPRYHNGGIAGLAPDEVPAILRKGEPVFRDMNHAREVAGGGATIQNSFAINYAGSPPSDPGEMAAHAAEMRRQFEAMMNDWAIKNQRSGGLLN